MCANKFSLAATITAALLSSVIASGQSITFEARGHMLEAYASDFAVGDTFVADFTFDPTVPPNPNVPDETQYISITSWTFRFDRGYAFAAAPNAFNPYVGYFDLINDYTNPLLGYGMPTDRYIVTLFIPNSVGQPLPSGYSLNILQFDLIDDSPAGSPDMLASDANPTTPPSLALVTSNYGRVDYAGAGIPPSPGLIVDSIAVVPEPSTCLLFILGASLLFARCRFSQN